jgi:hypothetical protein
MLEYIVRPFQAPNAHGTIIISSNPKETDERAIITWGGEATLPPVQYIETGFNTRKGREDFDEKQRDAEPVRITGEDPGDGPSYIDVLRSNKLYLDKDTSVDVSPSEAGQVDYAGAGSIYNTPPTSKKSKATITLKNNTTAAGG